MFELDKLNLIIKKGCAEFGGTGQYFNVTGLDTPQKRYFAHSYRQKH